MLSRILQAFGLRPRTRVLVLGFYDRGNLGDELYKIAIPATMKASNPRASFHFTFKCTDDADEVPPDIDLVICGGGDIINSYFMTKIAHLCKSYSGHVYAVSVGIPYADDVKYLRVFDHVYTRSTRDYELAVAEIGVDNVTQIADVVFNVRDRLKPLLPAWRDQGVTNIGIALAAPYFSAFPHLSSDLKHLCKILLASSNNVKIHVFAFNVYALSTSECDIRIAEELASEVEGAVTIHTSPSGVLEKIQQMHVNLCMRYHSVVLSMMFGVPFVALHATPKVERLLLDAQESLEAHFKLPTKNNTNLASALAAKLRRAMHQPAAKMPPQPRVSVPMLRYKAIVYKPAAGSWQPMIAKVEKVLSTYLGGHICLTAKKALDLGGRDPLQVARMICYIVTGDASHDCIWGLSKNMQSQDFVAEDAIRYIFNYHSSNKQTAVMLPPLSTKRMCIVNVDPFYDFSPANKVHRSGWAYVLSHLMNLDACRLGRQGALLFDTYVDRTFHWGLESLQTIGITPYEAPWMGIIHHTFDTGHSEFNCHNLFKNPVFLRALEHCKGLVALSEYLASQIRAALPKSAANIPVTAIYHPTQFVAKRFSWEAYTSNPDKKLIQVGAWLRRPYSLYALKIPKRRNIRKVALRGKNMEAYFPPDDTLPILADLSSQNRPTSAYTCDGASVSRGASNNKFVDGLLSDVVDALNSVEEIGPLDDDAYDDILTKNAVFLDLVDCSAVNTVIECIVRNTPIFVNRHPALEEVLGQDYPGFYHDFMEVPQLLTHSRLKAMHCSLTRLDKTKFDVVTFMTQLQDFIQKQGIR